jgi:hypothetical protein
MSIPTVASLRRQLGRVDRRRAGAARVRTAMLRGASLHLHFERGRPLWRLSTGIFVTDEVAKLVIAQPDIVGCGDSLFHNFPSQTWRHIEL